MKALSCARVRKFGEKAGWIRLPIKAKEKKGGEHGKDK